MENKETQENISAGSGSGFDYEKFAEDELARRKAEEKLRSGKKPAKKKGKGKEEEQPHSELFDWVQCLVSALIFCVLVFTFFVRTIGVIGQSMEPTFSNGDRVVISNLFYTPKQGDVVVLRKESFQAEPIIKRIIATENQTVSINFDTGTVYVDDVPLDEPYIAEPTHEAIDFTTEQLVPENCVFVMGDNRNHSSDSRKAEIGCVDERYIIGRVLFRVLPVDEFGVVE